jgi:4-carboxymuconolactone decarboxylase
MHSSEDLDRGRRLFTEITLDPPPTADTPFVRDGVIGAVFGDLWGRGVLPTRERRLISITCVCAASIPFAMDQHMRAALNSGDMSLDDLQEFVLHFAYYAGWPKAALAHKTLSAIAAELEAAGKTSAPAAS